MSGGPILHNDTQSPAEKYQIKYLAPKKNEIYLIKAWMSIFAEKKTNKEKEIYEDILGKEILSRKRERKADFTNAVMDLHL